jgi:hypothetical protein
MQNTDDENKGFPGNLLIKYVWEGRLHNNDVHISACALVVALGAVLHQELGTREVVRATTAFQCL